MTADRAIRAALVAWLLLTLARLADAATLLRLAEHGSLALAAATGPSGAHLPAVGRDLLRAAAWTIAGLLAARGAGRPVARGWLGWPRHAAWPAGFSLLALAVAGLGCAGLMVPGLLAALAGAAALAGFAGAARWPGRLRDAVRAARALPLTLFLPPAVALPALTLLAALPGSLEDPLVYHWAAPEHFLRAHRLTGAPWHCQWHYPLGIEMLFALGMAAGGLAAIKPVLLGVSIAAARCTAALATRLLGAGAAPAAWSALALAPALLAQVWGGKSDAGVWLYLAAAAALLPGATRSRTAALGLGWFLGAALGAKYTALYTAAGLLGWFALLRPRPGPLACAALATAAAGAVWPARNLLQTGNPLFPYASSLFGGLWWGPEFERGFHQYAARVSDAGALGWRYALRVWSDLLAAPIDLGGALTAFALPGIALAGLRGPVTGIVAAGAAFFFLLDQHNARFMLPLAALTAPLAVAGWRAARDRISPRLRPLPGIVLLASVPAALVHVLGALPLPALARTAGAIDAPEFESRMLSTWSRARAWCNTHLPPDARVWMFGEHKRVGWTMRVRSTHTVVLPPPWRWAHESATTARMAVKARQDGADWIVYNLVQARFRHGEWFPGPAWSHRALDLWAEFGRTRMREAWRNTSIDYDNGSLVVLRITRRPGPPLDLAPALPWTEALIRPAMAAASRQERALVRALVERTLERLPDSAGTLDQAAAAYAAVDLHGAALPHLRRLAAADFDGETNWYVLAVSEALAGRRRAAFAALRRHVQFKPLFVEQTRDALALLYTVWAADEAAAGRFGRACELVDMARRASPDYATARQLAGFLRCDIPPGSGIPVPGGRMLLGTRVLTIPPRR